MVMSSRVSKISAAEALLLVLLSFSSAVGRARADAMVTGTVFCDQCRDGRRSFLDYPLSGAKVAVTCAGSGGQVAEDTTNWFGTYGVRFEGSPDLSRCYAKVTGGPSGCWSGTGPSQGLRLLFSMFDMALYTVDPLLSQPEQPTGFCQTSPSPAAPGSGGNSVPPRPPVTNPSPPVIVSQPPRSPSPPAEHLPPVLPPFLRASACPYMKWTMPEYRCYWKVVGPDTKVAMAFGLIAAQRYGTDMTLWEGLHGRGDLYRTLLREATTALLNSYTSLQFFYPTLIVVDHMNHAVLGSPQQALRIALRFRRANSGAAQFGGASCNFSACH